MAMAGTIMGNMWLYYTKIHAWWLYISCIEAIKDAVDQVLQYRLRSNTPCAKMVLKLVLEFVVIFSLISSIRCDCKGYQAIVDAINANINELIKTLEDSCSPINPGPSPPNNPEPSPSSKFYMYIIKFFIPEKMYRWKGLQRAER